MKHIHPLVGIFARHGNLPERWRKWEQAMKLYLTIAMNSRTDAEQCSAFPYIIGQQGREILNTVTIVEEARIKSMYYCKSLKNTVLQEKI